MYQQVEKAINTYMYRLYVHVYIYTCIVYIDIRTWMDLYLEGAGAQDVLSSIDPNRRG